MKEFIIDREKKIVFVLTDDVKSVTLDDLKTLKECEKIDREYKFSIRNIKSE